jgi:hypothetical protein
MHRRSALEETIKEVLGDEFVHLAVNSYTMSEEIQNDGVCRVEVTLARGDRGGENEVISGSGVGFIDALYHGLVDHYAREYASLSTITFTGFEVTSQMSTAQGQGTDAQCVVTLVVKNTEGREFRFEDPNRSLAAAAINVVVEAAEYFINSERAYILVYKALCDARDRNRPDLIDRYKAQLAELVKTTSYSEVIQSITGSFKRPI